MESILITGLIIIFLIPVFVALLFWRKMKKDKLNDIDRV